jgi:VanZ family protein
MRKVYLWNWLPALLTMMVIFWFSSQPAVELPNFNWADRLVKKSGHVLGYALLALSYWFALGLEAKRYWLAWLLTILYAMTDEYHQSFVLGRHASAWDVVIFDNIGALLSLWWAGRYLRSAASLAKLRIWISTYRRT